MMSVANLPGERKCHRMMYRLMFDGFECPKCQSAVGQAKDYFWCSQCRMKVRPKAVSWFRSSKLASRQLLALLICWFRNVTPGDVHTTLGISYTTTARWYTRFRQHLPRDQEQLGGVVEADEAFFGRKKYLNQTIVMGAIERKSGRIKLDVIPDREQDSLELFLTKHVDRDSLINTDAWTGYYDLEWNGYAHHIYNHSAGHFGGTARAENIWSVAKRQQRRMYTKMLTRRLPELLREWEARRNTPHLFNDPYDYLKTCLFRIS